MHKQKLMIMIEISASIAATILGSVFSILTILIVALINTLSKNTDAFKKIEIALAKQETADGYEEKACTTRHTYIDTKLAQHSSKIEAHGMVIAEHELKIKTLQGI